MTNKTHSLALTIVMACSLLPGCEVDDADLDGSGLSAFTMTASATAVDVFEVDVAGTATLAYLANDDATLEILVDGASVYVESFDASTSLDLSFSATLPLSRQGPNDIVATLRYQGNELSQRAVVDVSAAAPTLAFPTWTTAFTQTGTANVSIATGWTVDAVEISRDGGEFVPAADMGGGAYELALTNLDIGDNALVARVTSSNRGNSQVHYFNDTVAGIVPVFECTSPTTSMMPNTELLEQLRIETRTMVGYFGDPNAHTFTFLIEYSDDGDAFQTVASVVSQARTTLMAEFDVDRADCGTTPCTQDYALSVYVDDDPTPLCSNNSFGIIRRY